MTRHILQNLRFASRALRKSPGFTLVAVMVLALGTGANTAIFSIFHAVLLRPLPFHGPDRVMLVFEKIPRRGVNRSDLCDSPVVSMTLALVNEPVRLMANPRTRSRFSARR